MRPNTDTPNIARLTVLIGRLLLDDALVAPTHTLVYAHTYAKAPHYRLYSGKSYVGHFAPSEDMPRLCIKRAARYLDCLGVQATACKTQIGGGWFVAITEPTRDELWLDAPGKGERRCPTCEAILPSGYFAPSPYARCEFCVERLTDDDAHEATGSSGKLYLSRIG